MMNCEKMLDYLKSHKSIPFDYEETAESRCEHKAVLKSRLVDDTSSLERWSAESPLVAMELSAEYCEAGKTAVKMSSTTRLAHWGEENYARIYTTPTILLKLDHENWLDYNRLSLCVRSQMPGFKFTSLNFQLLNEGDNPLPDVYFREGCHNMNLKNGEWTWITVEIPNLPRENIVGIRFGYDMVGNEQEAADTACFFTRDIRLEQVEADSFSGWQPGENVISFSGSGYQTGSEKIAIASGLKADTFKLVDARTGKVVLCKQISKVNNEMGTFQVLDFSEIDDEGQYLLFAGEQVTRVFPIHSRVWENAIAKTVNLFYSQRCGFEVPGVHKYCHGNVTVTHQGRRVVSNGGWHDAADMSQNLTNTAQAVYAFFEAAEHLGQGNPLFERIVEEGKWGLAWMLKTRFGDGFRAMDSGTSVWTSGIMGSCDDITFEARDYGIENFMAAAAEAKAASILKEIDSSQSRYLSVVAQEDWSFAYRKIHSEAYVKALDPARVSSSLVLYSTAIYAACEIFNITGDDYYRDKAAELGELILDCQQTEVPDWDIPLTGFFYRDESKKQIQHYNHRSHEHEPILALSRLCGLFPGHKDWPRWYHAIALYGEYLKKASEITAPYSMFPAGIYHIDEANYDPHLFLSQQAWASDVMLQDYPLQVQKGVALGKGY